MDGGRIVMKRLVVLIGLILFPSVIYAACTGSTPNYASTLDVSSIQTCFNNATHTGDTITLASGTGHIASQLTWTAPANAILIGAGTTTTGGDDVTVLIDDDTTNEALLIISTNATGTFRMTGLTIKGGLGNLKDQGVIKISGASAQARIDHFHWDGTGYSSPNNGKFMYITGEIYGVLDHSILDLQNIGWIHFANSADNSGDAHWAASSNWGSASFFYIEDNIINGHTTNTVYDSALTDCVTAGRFVVRFNTVVDAGISQTHPTGHSGNDRGCRAHENYANSVTSNHVLDPNFAFDYNNSGSAMVWNNSVNNVYKNIIYFNDCRQDTGCGYTQSDTPTGWGWCGTAHSGTGSNWDRNDSASLGYPCIDQPGRGQGDLLTGDFPSKTNSATGTVHWPNQVQDPQYMWMQTGSVVAGWGGSALANISNGRIISDTDYYIQASGIQTNATTPFNGTTGTGWGTLANRPTTCTTGSESGGGVGYFATDQGSWNASASNPYGVQMNGADGVLYRCSATNTWTVTYTPYTYPHPLNTSSAGGSIVGTARGRIHR